MARPRRCKGGRTQARVQPEGQVRQSQAVTTFGPGATMDLVKQAVLVGGLDFWRWSKDKGIPILHEPRLRDALAPRFADAGRPLSVEAAFREPPAGDDRDPSRSIGVQVLEFPRWFVCQSPRCRALTGRALDLKDGRYWHRCSERDRALGGPTECVPVRFLGACKKGHVEDWPWIAFVHRDDGGPRCPSPQLKLEEGATGDFSQVIARCVTCDRFTPLSAAYAQRFGCGGHRLWLGNEGKEECNEDLRLLIRTASNSYFAQVVSALSIPDPANALDEKIAEVWDVLLGATADNLGVLRTAIPKVQVALAGYSDTDVLAAIERRRKGQRSAREPLRTAEFRQLIASKAEVPGELPPEDETFFARRVTTEEPLPALVERLIVAPKLREVRAQIGFTRIEPVTPDLQGEFDLGVQSARLGLTTDWLPATEIRGEGVLIQLNEQAVAEWEQRASVQRRARELLAGHDALARTQESRTPFPGVRFYMLHSLSHLLVSAISLECGYAASAIRERIYCAGPTDPVPMAAILLATGASGSEGTLGGLVEHGRVIHEHLRRAFDLGELCSNDPVCAGHSPADDPAERWLEGAACHGCLFVAECSCEWFNRRLDRALVVPTIGHPPDLAFVAKRP
ncbi:MAG: DUF1998 domain-containing protein [Sandaracinaceae bacterium]|nr:DUF1998 domain-containing protein [Sandaracinaceae bacterium]